MDAAGSVLESCDGRVRDIDNAVSIAEYTRAAFGICGNGAIFQFGGSVCDENACADAVKAGLIAAGAFR